MYFHNLTIIIQQIQNRFYGMTYEYIQIPPVHYCELSKVRLKMTRKGTCRQWRRKANIESNVTERSALLKQHSKKQHRLSKPRTTERARCAACAAAEVVFLR